MRMITHLTIQMLLSLSDLPNSLKSSPQGLRDRHISGCTRVLHVLHPDHAILAGHRATLRLRNTQQTRCKLEKAMARHRRLPLASGMGSCGPVNMWDASIPAEEIVTSRERAVLMMSMKKFGKFDFSQCLHHPCRTGESIPGHFISLK